MDFFDKHKALILTVLSCSLLLLILYNLHLSNSRQTSGEMLVNLDEYIKEKAEQKEAEKQNQPEEQRKQVETHKAFNENQEARKENFDRQLNKIFDKNSARQEESSQNEAASGDYDINKPKEKKERKASHGDDSSKKTSTKSGGIRNSSISFSLKGRSAVMIPNPVYTCDTPGKIVINITVDAEGIVTETSYNKASSTSDNECLIEQAMKYAKDARFSKLAGRDQQPGTITYHFKP